MKKGTTATEVVLGMAIAGILGMILVPNYLLGRMKADISLAYSDLKNIQTAIEVYRLRMGSMPIPDPEPGSIPTGHYARYKHLLEPRPFLAEVPIDPFFPDSVQHGPGERVYQLFVRDHETEVFEGLAIKYGDYFIRSAGPDRFYTESESDFYNNYYSTSNGINSAGDILMVRAGGHHE